MLFARIRPLWLFLLLFLPALTSGILAALADHFPLRHYRFLVLSLNLSTFFAMIFVCWIATLVYLLAPRFRSKFLVFAGLGIGVLFRLWQDSFLMGALNASGQIPSIEFISLDSPVFVMHVIVSLFMIGVLILLPLWLLKKEKALGIEPESKGKTILWFFIFPIGIWFIQPRVQKVLSDTNPES
jgi:hypothetical protein